jgi:hypothetical protein
MRSRILLTVIALSIAACGGGQKSLRVDDARLVRLPPEARQQLIDEEREVRVAETNLEAARVAEREAREFQAIVEKERSAAREFLEAAQKAQKLARQANDGSMAAGSTSDEAAARERLRAVDAKLEYAKQLASYRVAVVRQREAELDAARADLEVRKVSQLAAAGQADGLDTAEFDRAAANARRRADDAQVRAQSRRGDVEARRASWQAARGTSTTGVDDAPPPPSALE